MSMSWLPPVPYSVSQKTASKNPQTRKPNSRKADIWWQWDGELPNIGPFLNPMPVSAKQFILQGYNSIWCHNGHPKSPANVLAAWSLFSQVIRLLPRHYCSCLCACSDSQRSRKLLWFFYNWTGPFVIDQRNIAARFQKSKPSNGMPCPVVSSLEPVF